MVIEFAALLTAGLEDDIVLRDRIDDPPALGDVVRQRLLAVDVLFRPSGENADDRVPVVGRGADDRVDVLAVDDLSEVAIGVAALVRSLLALGIFSLDIPLRMECPLRDDIADGQDLDVLHFEEAMKMAAILYAQADKAECQPFARRSFLRFIAEGRRGRIEEWGCGAGPEELPAGEGRFHRWPRWWGVGTEYATVDRFAMDRLSGSNN